MCLAKPVGAGPTVATKKAFSIALEAFLFFKATPKRGGVATLALVLGLVWLAYFCGHDRRNTGSAAGWFEWELCRRCFG